MPSCGVPNGGLCYLVTCCAGSGSRPRSVGHSASVRTTCPHLDATASHVTEFAKILTNQGGEHLDEWMASVEADELPHPHRFVRGLRRDYDAVLNGLTLPHNSGAVEGNVNRIKRQMYGRANFDLLRKRILHAV